MAEWRIVKRTLFDGESFQIERKDKRGNWVGGYGVASTLEEAKEQLSKLKEYMATKKDKVVYQE